MYFWTAIFWRSSMIRLLKRRRHRVSPGSDLTAAVISSVIKPNDVVG